MLQRSEKSEEQWEQYCQIIVTLRRPMRGLLGKRFSRQRPRNMPWKTLEKSGLKLTAPNRLADQKDSALSTHPNPNTKIALHRDLGCRYANT